MTDTNDSPTPMAKSKSKGKVIALLVIAGIVIIFVAVAVALNMNTTEPAPSTNTQSTEGSEGEAQSMPDVDSMYHRTVDSQQAAIDADPSNVDAHLALGSTYVAWAEMVRSHSASDGHTPDELYSSAAENFMNAVELDPMNATALQALGYAYFDWAHYLFLQSSASTEESDNLYRQSLTYYERATDGSTTTALSDEEVANINVNRAVAYYALDDQTQAISILENQRTTHPEHLETLINLGIFYQAMDNDSGALEVFTAAQGIAEANGNTDLVDAIKQQMEGLQGA